jgi:hypothetical protein
MTRLRITVDGRAELRAPHDPLVGPHESVDAEDKTLYLDGPVTVNSDGPVSVEVERHEPDESGGHA